MRNIIISGKKEYVIAKLQEVMNVQSAERFIELIKEAKIYIDGDDVLNEEIKVQHISGQNECKIIYYTNYHIHLKAETMMILAFIYDLVYHKEFLSTLSSLKGFNFLMLNKLNTYNGEKCVVIDAIQEKNHRVTFNSILKSKKTCNHLNFKCKYCVGNLCTLRRNDLMNLMSDLVIKNIFMMSDSDFKLNW